MNWSSIETSWNDYKANAQQQWSRLTEEQVNGTMGARARLSIHVQEAYALSKEEAERQISAWQSKQVETQQAPAAKS